MYEKKTKQRSLDALDRLRVFLNIIMFPSKVGLLIRSHLKSHFNRKSTSSRLQVGFGPSQVGFTK